MGPPLLLQEGGRGENARAQLGRRERRQGVAFGANWRRDGRGSSPPLHSVLPPSLPPPFLFRVSPPPPPSSSPPRSRRWLQVFLGEWEIHPSLRAANEAHMTKLRRWDFVPVFDRRRPVDDRRLLFDQLPDPIMLEGGT